MPENAVVIFITKKELKNNSYNHVAEDDDGNIFELSHSENSIYNGYNKFMVSWWGADSYFNIEIIQNRDIENIISAYSSSGSFGFRVRSKYIGHNTYTSR